MRSAFRLRGTRGAVVWGYHTAIALTEWRIRREQQPGTKYDTGWRLRATVTSADAFLAARRPLYFTAPHAKGVWCWPVASLTLTGATLTATLRSPEQ